MLRLPLFPVAATGHHTLIQAQNNLVEASLQRIQAQAKWQSARLTLVVQGDVWELTQDTGMGSYAAERRKP